EATSDIPGNTLYYITDNEWNGTSFNSGENITTWTAPAEGVLAGSTILISDDTGPTCGTSSADAVPAFTTSGEEVYVTSVNPSGAVAAANICFAVSTGGNGVVTGLNSVDLGNIDNGAYSGSGSINDASNWNTSNSVINLGTGSCILAPLPVDLVSFSAKMMEKEVALHWLTASEQNNDYFLVEHSTDGRSFEALSEIKGAGTTAEAQEYVFMHDRPNKGLNYYRLLQVDFDGTSTYSAVEVVEIETQQGSIRVFPSLASEKVQVQWAAPVVAAGTIQVFDLTGQLLLDRDVEAQTAELTINIADLQRGHYFIRINIGEDSTTQRFIKMD
ncbi:MAG: T9SS type A sorting domain-containing protein, partial [Bacteroidota bacterium]